MSISLKILLTALIGMTVLQPKIDFGKNKINSGWFTILDGVMGGRSSGEVSFSKESLIFSGDLSLENNGGFSSMRSPKEVRDLSGYSELVLRVKGDGRTYGFMLEPSTRSRTPYYKHQFDTEKDVWTEVRIPIADFSPFFYGRQLSTGMDAETQKHIERLGVILADKNPGSFKLEIDYIEFE